MNIFQMVSKGQKLNKRQQRFYDSYTSFQKFELSKDDLNFYNPVDDYRKIDQIETLYYDRDYPYYYR